MSDTDFLWPHIDMDFWKIKNDEYKVSIDWTRNYFEDYKKLFYDFYECGYSTFCDIINSGDNNIKCDMWFLASVFLLRQGMELGLKALICRSCKKNSDIQSSFIGCRHDLSALFQRYSDITYETYLTIDEIKWLELYLSSIEQVDEKSDMFRFPFEDCFLAQFRDKFIDIVPVVNNMLQAFSLIKKCIENGNIPQEDEFDNSLEPEFFIFASHGMGNCYLWQGFSDSGFYVKVSGYIAVSDYIYNNNEININTKIYPLMFMLRNTLELCLKRLFYSRVDNGVPRHIFYAKKRVIL